MLTVVAGSAEHCCCMFLLLNTVAAAGAEHRGAESVSNKIRIVHKSPLSKIRHNVELEGSDHCQQSQSSQIRKRSLLARLFRVQAPYASTETRHTAFTGPES